MKKNFSIFLLLVLVLFAGMTFFLWQNYQSFLIKPLGLTNQLSVAKGTSAYRLGKQWEQEGIIDNFYNFQLLLKMKPELRSIKAGEYQVSPELTTEQLLQKLVDGKVISYQFSVIEGSNVYELLTQLAHLEHIKSTIPGTDDFYNTVFPFFEFTGQQHPEGMFFADTYQYNKGDDKLDLLKRANKKLKTVLEDEWNNKAENLPYKTPYEALIMASIIEKETAVAAERPIIAGVFVRRLAIGMKLQTDPTIIYGLVDDPEINYDGNIRRKDITNPHPWNTYVHYGLPPTPIAMVGREAIHAALHPEDGKALYFVAKGDGSHQFSATLAEHNRAVRKYQLKR